MNLTVSKMDHQGNGIAYLDKKIVFIPKTIPGDIVDVKIIKEKKNYSVGKVSKYLNDNKQREKPFCPYYDKCGGCHLQNLTYEDTLKYKYDKVKNILEKLNIRIEPILIENPEPLKYRNKIEVKMENKRIGFYEKESNTLVEINACLITQDIINKTLPFLKEINLENGLITIRTNSKNEVLVIISTKDKIDITLVTNYPFIKGIILNDKTIYGQNYLEETINNFIFQYTYDAFFQVNPYGANLLFKKIEENITNKDTILDLYAGVGTLGISSSKQAKEILGIELIKSAVANANYNVKLNNISNAKYILGDVETTISGIANKYNTWIVDPPRKGLDNKTKEVFLKYLPDKLIYVSCNIHSLVRDLAYLINKYDITKFYILDMFSYTYHEECIVILHKNY